MGGLPCYICKSCNVQRDRVNDRLNDIADNFWV